jgi:UPF0288 family protein (methanogenesis marker protein 3)
MNLRQSENLIQEINKTFAVDLLKKSRSRHLVDIRHCAMYSLRDRSYTLAFIADMFDKNHATVIHACKKMKQLYGLDRDYTKLCVAVDDVINKFFEEEKIFGRNAHAESYESLKIGACRLISEYVTDNNEIEEWLTRFDLTWKEFRLFTSRQL